MYFKHLKEIFLPKHHSQTCPATKHHTRIEKMVKNEGSGIEKNQIFLEGQTTHPPKHLNLQLSVLRKGCRIRLAAGRRYNEGFKYRL